MGKRYFNTAEMATYLSRSEKAIRELCFRRRIPHSKPGGRLLFDVDQIEEWIHSNEVVTLEEIEQEDGASV